MNKSQYIDVASLFGASVLGLIVPLPGQISILRPLLISILFIIFHHCTHESTETNIRAFIQILIVSGFISILPLPICLWSPVLIVAGYQVLEFLQMKSGPT